MNREPGENRRGQYMGWGVGIGLAIGAGIGAAFQARGDDDG
jgi:hypothetical protein